ncbi:MAG TPA: amidohydrolase family protein [Ktedonobacterales bacterium]
MASRTLLKNGTVITVDKQLGNFRRADVLIDGAKIAAVGPDLAAGDAEVIDAANMIVMPGFIDTHRHMWEGILRNIGVDYPLEGDESYLAFVLNVLAPVYRPEDVYAGNLISTLGALHSGITSILDWSHIQASPEHTDAAIKALQDSGMRAVFAYGPPWYEAPKAEHPEWFKRVANQYFSSKDQLLTLSFAALGPEFSELGYVKENWILAREHGARVTAHVGVGSFGKHGKVLEAGRAGVFGPDTTFIHCTSLSDDEIQLIVDTGGTVSLASPVEMMMGHGLPPTQRFLDRGLRPSLSVDVETNVPGDMFTQMRSVIALQHALIFDQKLAGKENLPPPLNARDVLEFATIQGARANGLDHKTGSLTPGKDADVILLRMDDINIVPVNDPIGAVVWGMDTSNVDSVFVAGKAMKRGGRLTGDVDRARKLAVASRDYVVAKSGFKLPAF